MFYRWMILTGMFLIMCTSLLQAGTVTYDFSDPAQIQGWEQFSEACWNGVDSACGGNPPPFKHEWAVGDGVLNQSVNNVRTCDNGGPNRRRRVLWRLLGFEKKRILGLAERR